MVTLWRERHGLCKSHFVERNWYMFPAKIFPAEIFPQFVQTQHSRTLPTDQKSKSRGRRRPDLLPQHAPRPLRAHPTQLTQNTRRSACSSAPIELCHAPSVARTTPIVDHRMGEQEATPSLDCVWPAPRFLNHFCKLMLRDGRCRLHNKINRALALMKCPGNEHLEGARGALLSPLPSMQ